MKKSTIKPLSTLVSCLTITASLGLTTLAPLLITPAPHAIAQVNGDDDSNAKETGEDDTTTIDASFMCKRPSGKWTTVVNSSSRPNEDTTFIVWASNAMAGSGFNNQRRCQMVSVRLNSLLHNGQLEFITSGTVNQQPVICGARNNSEGCAPDNVIFTLRRNDQAVAIIKQLYDLQRGLSNQPLYQSQAIPSHVSVRGIIQGSRQARQNSRFGN
jgi:hypothetical protein